MSTSARSPRLLATAMTVAVLATLTGSSDAAAVGDNSAQYPSALLCETGRGCTHSPISGTESREFWEILFATEMPGSNTVLCSAETGCTWSALSDEEADILFGGDGTPEGQRGMVFDEDEGTIVVLETSPSMEFTEDEVAGESSDTPEPMEFTEEEVTSAITVTPMAGSWTSSHAPGVMDCGVVVLDIPGGDVETGEMTVAADGSRFTALAMASETESLDMVHVGGGSYHTDFVFTEDGTEMVLNFDIVFVDPGLGQGLIWADIANGDASCRIERPFVAVHASVDFFDGVA